MKVREIVQSVLELTSLKKEPVSPYGKNTGWEPVFNNSPYDIKQIVDRLMDQSGSPAENEGNSLKIDIPNTVDILKSGSPDMEVTGVAVTFIATVEVIQKAIDSGANLIITHEPTFYNHADNTEWLEGDKVYSYKKKLIEDNNITIWRFHDLIHLFVPECIVEGAVKSLGWEYCVKEQSWGCAVFEVDGFSLESIASYIKEKLGTERLSFIGKPNMPVKRVGIMVGAQGGTRQISFFKKYNVDLLICGEINEWEVSEYVRDAAFMGEKMALIVTGHYESEKDGMKYLAENLKTHIKGTPVSYIECRSPFK
jgi:Uncharacterized conserved protein